VGAEVKVKNRQTRDRKKAKISRPKIYSPSVNHAARCDSTRLTKREKKLKKWWPQTRAPRETATVQSAALPMAGETQPTTAASYWRPAVWVLPTPHAYLAVRGTLVGTAPDPMVLTPTWWVSPLYDVADLQDSFCRSRAESPTMSFVTNELTAPVAAGIIPHSGKSAAFGCTTTP